ncbi:MAG: energy transducer TonB [Opitutaceae bacterium]|jgi:protein TonB|nr:energy transducer TonB [Opitutaceae bacterium]HRG54564.1 energy transducer TonB [Lacunisphaera sp.]
MNKDLIIGLLVSVGVHLFALNPFAGKQPPPVREAIVKEEIIQMEMPPLDEEEDKKVEELQDEPAENVMAPPSLVDLPTVVPVNAFTQPLQPPPPPGMSVARGAINIPVNPPGANFGKGIKDLFDINNLDQKPVGRVQNPPQYPYEMSRAGISGEVVVEFIISASGDVVDTRVVRSSHREFEVPAMQAVQKWKFKPGRKAGKNVSTRVSQLIEFNLEDSK